MSAEQIVRGVYQIPIGIVNAFLLDSGDLTLIDTGVPGSAETILTAVREIGRDPQDIKHILVTHLHTDHAGSLLALKEATGAPALMHPLDADMVRRGEAMRPATAAPGLVNKLITSLMGRRAMPGIDPTPVEEEITDGQVLEQCGGLRVLHVPGHSAGQVAFLWPEEGGVLFAADSASNMMGLGYPPIFEDFDSGLASLRRLGRLDFAVACFGHGKAIRSGAAGKFRRKWS